MQVIDNIKKCTLEIEYAISNFEIGIIKFDRMKEIVGYWTRQMNSLLD